MLFDVALQYARVARPLPAQFRPAVDHPGGCYSCRYFGYRVDLAVWCAKRGCSHVRSQADRGCAFWEREPGADDELPVSGTPELRHVLDDVLALSAAYLARSPLGAG